ncbi:5-oxoprolinase subunit C family protein [Botryobacter ruber]|uniref:5-oxoprolinase subunit C family protein n=1 Tax=Botryobacter ruber TaxID=2171629 RepID=UPI000E0C5095|nr:biotin-dependent carboxyltransferase family protein [Botryobacter ruber]
MSLEIIKPGVLTTIQDAGRYGYQKDGILVSGAMDTVALRIANLLVGNLKSDAALEATITGPQVKFASDQLIAVTGADMAPAVDGTPIKMWRPVFVKKGSTLKLGSATTGCRTYVAFSGSFAIPKVLGSYATYLRAAVGGYEGRALQAGDVIPCNEFPEKVLPLLEQLQASGNGHSFCETKWAVDPHVHPVYQENPEIQVLRGPEYDRLSELSKMYLWKEKFQVTAQSDRMGYQLLGVTLSLSHKTELISTAVTFGTVQVPPKGSLIILMADRQTTGGYPRVAQVITADLPLLAQVPPGKVIRFKEVSLEEAQMQYLKQEYHLEQCKQGLEFKFRA